MKSDNKTKNELIAELESVRRKVKELETLLKKRERTEQNITERKQAEEALRESEERITKAFRSIPDALAISCLENGKLVEVNDNWQKIFGYSREEVIGKSSLALNLFVDSADRQRVIALLREQGFVRDFELQIRQKSGALRTAILSVELQESHGDQYLISVVQDTTERKRSEEALQESEMRYRSVLQSATDAIVTVDGGGNIIGWNSAAEQIFGYSYTEAVGLSLTSIISLYHHEENSNGMKGLQTEGGQNVIGKTVEFKGLRKDKSVFPIELSLSTWETKSEQFFTGIIRDITERKRAEEALVQEQYLMNMLMANVPDHIYFKDTDSRFIRISNDHAKKFGLSNPTQAIGKTDFDFFKEEHARPAFEDEQTIIRTGKPIVGIEEKETWPDGRETWVSTTKMPLRDKEGNIIGTFGISRDITDQKQAEETILKERTLLRTLIDNLPVGVFVKDKKGRKTIVNPIHIKEIIGHLKYLGINSEIDILGKTDFEVFPEELAQNFFVEDQKVIRDGSLVLNDEGLGFSEEGNQLCLLVSKIPLRDNNGEIIGMVGVANDITERKQAVEALRETSNYLENLLSFANAPIMVWDNNNKITKFNLAFERMTGYTMYDVLGKNPEILFSDDKRIEISTLISRTSDGENLISVELPVRCKNGIIRNVLWNTSNIYTKDSKTIIATIANGQDVTERKRAEESLQESELRFRSLYENATIGIYRSTPDGSILLANPALVKMLGYTSFQQLAERNLEIDGFEPSSQRKKFLDKIERDGEVIGYESKWILQDGRAVFVLENARAIRDAQGKTLYYDGTVEDITERKQMEEGLRQMQKLEGLGTLAGGIAHDFNNILGIILAYITSTIRYKDDAEKLDLAVDTIVKAVERGKTLVQQILTFARRTETEFRPVNVNDIVKEIMVMIFETFPKILTYAQNIDQGVSYINADRSQLHQLLLNLCVNARDAMPNGGLLTINTQMVSGASLLRQHPDAVESNYVCIEVRDTGEGMTPETSKRIFEPFFTTKELGKGTGLGLAVVFGVVQTHKGFIDVESELGKGTTFSVYLPASQVAEPIIVKDEATLEETPGGTETLLVVEDEEMLMMTLQMLLVEKGYKVLSAEDGLTAWKIYQERKNDIALVLTDLGLPKMTGMEECVQIKKLNPLARIIVATGYLDSGMKSEFLKTGIQHFLFKPYDLKKVLKEIREVLDEK